MTSPVLLLLFWIAATLSTSLTAHAHPEPTPTARPRTHTRNPQNGDYAFAYAVDSPDYSNFHDRAEARSGDETRGRFRVALPDNRLQTVLYRADGKGYTAFISYDDHPDFSALRASIGPIGAAPEIGQSVLESIRRGENWKAHKDQKDGRRPDHEPQDTSHEELDNTVVSTSRRVQPTTRQSRVSSAPRRQPTPSRPSTSSQAASRRPATKRPASPASQRLRTATPVGSAPSTSKEPISLFISEDFYDDEILNRLMKAINKEALKDAQEAPLDDDSEEKAPHRHYAIGDKASVLARLKAVVHRVQLAHRAHLRG
ncbi:uncharacterized protein [Cherax quadricarinatus]|uniref:uncharacterized protein n=1 Tax=Cherax quadricarinatus TaxID=27406 RepID=UPI00387EBF84